MATINKKSFFGIVLVIIFLIFLFNVPPRQIKGETYVKIAGQVVRVDLAETPAQQEQGLSGRSGLKENEGMLFVFDKAGKYAFWMKDMKFSIDMIWMDKDFKVVYIKKDALPESFPESYGPAEDSQYVLEVSADFSDKNNLKVGDSVEFSH